MLPSLARSVGLGPVFCPQKRLELNFRPQLLVTNQSSRDVRANPGVRSGSIARFPILANHANAASRSYRRRTLFLDEAFQGMPLRIEHLEKTFALCSQFNPRPTKTVAGCSATEISYPKSPWRRKSGSRSRIRRCLGRFLVPITAYFVSQNGVSVEGKTLAPNDLLVFH